MNFELDPKTLEAMKKRERMFLSKISDALIDFAGLYNDLPTSDLQGMADIEAKKILTMIKKEVLK